MTNRIVSNQSSPTVQFILEADATADAAYGDHGRWRIRFYLKAVNTGTSSSSYSGSGYQTAVANATEVDRHSGNPFLPAVAAGATRWRDGPTDAYREANASGYWSGTSTSFPVYMDLVYGSIDVKPSGSVPLPRIARVPDAPSAPTVSAITSTSVTLTWTTPAAGNAAITNYQWQIATDAAFANVVITASPTGISDNTADNGTLSPGVTYYARVRAKNGDGYSAWSATTTFKTLAGVFVSDGTTWKVAEVYVSDGSQWLPGTTEVSDGTAWKPAG